MSIIRKVLSTILLPKQLVITVDGSVYKILRSDPGFEDIYKASKAKDIATVETHLKRFGYIKSAIEELSKEVNKVLEVPLSNPQFTEKESTSTEDGDYEEEDDYVPKTDYPPVKDVQQTRPPIKDAVKDNVLRVDDHGNLTINGFTFGNLLAKKIADLYMRGYDIKSYIKLIQKIVTNTEAVVQSGLLDFIAQNDLPITTDGNFLAYKVTAASGFDLHSGTVEYKVGEYVSMDRKLVDSSRGVCSGPGLYFASIGYYRDISNYTKSDTKARFIVEVDPLDVVAIPTTYNNSKGRCCRMKVLRRVDWNNPDLIPNNTDIIDTSNWITVTPTEDRNKAVSVELQGTQKVVDSNVHEIPTEILEPLQKYIERRHGDGVNPTLRNAQKALNRPGTSVGVIAEAVAKLGFLIVNDPESNSLSGSTIHKDEKKI